MVIQTVFDRQYIFTQQYRTRCPLSNIILKLTTYPSFQIWRKNASTSTIILWKLEFFSFIGSVEYVFPLSNCRNSWRFTTCS